MVSCDGAVLFGGPTFSWTAPRAVRRHVLVFCVLGMSFGDKWEGRRGGSAKSSLRILLCVICLDPINMVGQQDGCCLERHAV